jgi:hypothetical protein
LSAVGTTPNPKTRKPEEMESLRLFFFFSGAGELEPVTAFSVWWVWAA